MHASDRNEDQDGIAPSAHAEMRLGHGAAWTGSRHEGCLFVALGGVPDGAYCDDQLDVLIDEGRIVVYGTAHDGLFPASEIGPEAARELFRLGAAEVADAIDGGRPLRNVIMPLTQSLCGQGVVEQGADMMSLGRLWALCEYAKGVQPMRDIDFRSVADRTYLDLVSHETHAGSASAAPELRRLH